MNILFLTSNYLPNPSANGINSRNIIEELKKRGHEVTCISVQREGESDFEDIENTNIYRLPPSRYSQLIEKYENSNIRTILLRMLRMIKLVFLLYDFPNHDPRQAKRIMHKMQELHNKNNFDMVIGVHKPYSNIAALLEFKRKYSTVKCVSYYLDLTNSHFKPKLMPQKVYKHLCFKADINVFKTLDLSLIAKRGARYYDHEDYNNVKDKIKFVDFPTFMLRNLETENPIETESNKNNVISLVFAGTLNRDYRNPASLLECLSVASKKIGKIEFHIYGHDNCDEIIDKYDNFNLLKIIKHGFVGHETVIQALRNADFVVNISNTLEDAVPSKIFEIMSIGKPIINVFFRNDDASLEYFSKYPSVFYLYPEVDLNCIGDQLAVFIKQERNQVFDVLEIRKQFIENTPEYTADIIERIRVR